MDDIVITGIGVISASGIGKKAFWENCLSGRTGIRPIQAFDTSTYSSHLGGEARDFAPRDFMPPMKYRRMSRVSRMAVSASIEALRDASLNASSLDPEGVGVILGTGYGSTAQTDEFFLGMLREGPNEANPILFPDTVPNAPASQIAIYHGLKGPNVTFSHNEISGEQALAYACRLLQEDRGEAFLAGSVDELSSVLFHSFAVLNALSPQKGGEEAMRPFDRRRNGRVLGEGAGVLVLEKRSRAKQRGARVYGSIVARASTGGPIGPQHYETESVEMARAIRLGLKQAGISPEQLGYISAAANSTPELDRAEAGAIGKVFCGERAAPISSLKGHIGDFCGAGGLRAVALLLSLHTGKIPITCGLEDPEYPLDYVMGRPREIRLPFALLNGFSFGGSNVCLIFKKEPSLRNIDED